MESIAANVSDDLGLFMAGDKVQNVKGCDFDYKLLRPETAVNALAASSTSEQPDINVPSRTFKPAACAIEYFLTGVSPGATNCPRLSIGSPACQLDYFKTYFASNSSAILCEVNQPARVFKAMVRCIPLDVFLTLPAPETGTGLDASGKLFPLSPVCPVTSAAVEVMPARPSSATTVENAIGLLSDSQCIAEFFVGADADAVYAVKMHIPMYTFVHTFWTLNDYIYFPDILKIKLRFLGYNDFAFLTTSAGNDMTGAANPTAITLTANSLVFKHAVCNNPKIHDQVKASCIAGVRLSIPWIDTTTKTVTASTANQKVQQSYGVSIGKYLKRVYVQPLPTTRTTSLQLNHNNAGGLLYTSLRTYIDGQEIQSNAMSATAGEVYQRIAPLYSGSCLTSAQLHAYNDFYVDNWTGDKADNWMNSDFEDRGYLVGASGKPFITYEVEISTGAQCNAVMLSAVFNKYLIVSGNNVSILATDNSGSGQSVSG